MASYVVKVQFEDNLRRMTLEGDLALSFAQLESRTRDMFHLPSSSQLVLTYVDSDGDVVTMAEDQDLRDALVLQSLNPLRLRAAILHGAKENAASNIKIAAASLAGQRNAQSQFTNEETRQAEKTGDVNDGSKPAENTPVNDTAARLDENPTPTGEAEKEEQKAAGNDTGGAATDEAWKEEQMIHHGITCDDCGVIPITGPRFKSTKKYDYDLCGACFDKPGVDPNEYFMVERRLHRPALRNPFWGGRMMRLNPAFDSRNPNSRNARGTAECARAWGSRCPGAEGVRGGAPENGRVPPPAANQEKQDANGSASDVVHRGVKCDGCGMNPITGLRFISNTKFNYDLCSGCFEKSEDGVKAEYTRIDRSANGVHPVVLRRWYSATPYRSPVCGRGIWVINKLAQEQEQKKEAAGQHSTEEKSAAAEAVPKEATQPSTGEKSAAAEAVPKEVTQPSMEEPSVAAAVAAAVADASEKQAEVPTVTNEAPVTETDSEQQAEPEVEKNTSTPQADATVENSTVPVPVNIVQNDTPTPTATEGDLTTIDGLLSKLASMGFTDKQLNEELLKKNNMDLRTTLDDLCAAEEWDPILEELQEMGFYDNDMNRRLMFANNGSVKRVVKELVQKAKVPPAAAAKGEKQA